MRVALLDGGQDVRDVGHAAEHTPAEGGPRPENHTARHLTGRLPSVLLSVCTSARRHGIDPWAYLTHVLSELPIRTSGADLADLLPDVWAKSRGETRRRAG